MTKETGILINKTGELKEVKINDLNELYKLCKFKKPDNFDLRHTWKIRLKETKYKLNLYAKNDGRANTENKYDLPPPVDNDLFFGSMLVIAFSPDDELLSLTIEIWEKLYEKMFGGFEDLKDTAKEDEEEEDELENIPDSMKTKEGYLKDGFIVDDDVDEEGDYEEEDEDYEGGDEDDDDDDELDECGSELAYEDYVYSDED